jgi:hypothetical protein
MESPTAKAARQRAGISLGRRSRELAAEGMKP